MFEARVSEIPEPVGDWTILKIVYEHTSKGGIIVPQSAYDQTPSGEVMAVGPGVRNPMTGALHELPWKPGDILLVNGAFVDLGKYEDSVIESVPALIVPGAAPTPPKNGARLVAVQERCVIAKTKGAR
jgi:co-chaperonin GroES (HSP10)